MQFLRKSDILYFQPCQISLFRYNQSNVSLSSSSLLNHATNYNSILTCENWIDGWLCNSPEARLLVGLEEGIRVIVNFVWIAFPWLSRWAPSFFFPFPWSRQSAGFFTHVQHQRSLDKVYSVPTARLCSVVTLQLWGNINETWQLPPKRDNVALSWTALL